MRNARLGRKGMWTQVFLIMFFIFLVVIAVVLLSLEKSRLNPDNQLNEENLLDQRANIELIALLRRPVTVTDSAGTTTAPLADIIILNFDRKYDSAIKDALQKSLPKDTYIRLVIHYPDGKWVRYEERGNTLEQGSSTATLPGHDGNIKIEFSLKKLIDSTTTIPALEMDNDNS